MQDLHQILTKAAVGVTDEDAPLVRSIIKMVTGGRIDLFQHGERLAQRGWLQGRFRVTLIRLVLNHCTGRHPTPEDEAVEITVDYRQPVSFAADADRAWKLYSEQKRQCDIAEVLGCSHSQVTKLLKYAAKQRGETLEDGRKRRHSLPGDANAKPLYQRIADEVKRLSDEQLLMHEIATRLRCDISTVTKALAFWHALRGLVVADGRTRRKSLLRKQAPKSERQED
jgi:predicted transcriptional regulator